MDSTLTLLNNAALGTIFMLGFIALLVFALKL